MKAQFRIATGLLLLTVLISLGTYQGWWNLHVPAGPLSLIHWLGVIGGAYLLILVPVYSYLKRRTPQRRGTLLKVHVFGNLLAFLLVSVHVADHLGGHAPAPGTGLASAILMVAIVAFGFMLRFGLGPRHRESWRVLHVGLSASLLVVVGIHTLVNFGLL